MTHLVSTDVEIRGREMTEEWVVVSGRVGGGGARSEEEMEKEGC